MLTEKQIKQLANEPSIKATAKANEEVKAKKREADLMLLGYNQALQDTANWPEGHTAQSWNEVIEFQKTKLGIEY
jgi:hypothetical protein